MLPIFACDVNAEARRSSSRGARISPRVFPIKLRARRFARRRPVSPQTARSSPRAAGSAHKPPLRRPNRLTRLTRGLIWVGGIRLHLRRRDKLAPDSAPNHKPADGLGNENRRLRPTQCVADGRTAFVLEPEAEIALAQIDAKTDGLRLVWSPSCDPRGKCGLAPDAVRVRPPVPSSQSKTIRARSVALG